MSKIQEDLYDVVAVNLGNTVRLIAESKTLANAEAIVSMAVMRRGCDEEFYSAVPAGSYAAGDTWTGNKMPKKAQDTEAESNIIVIGNTAYPNGPRGL